MKINYYYKNLNLKEKANLKTLVDGKAGQLWKLIAGTPETALDVKGEKTAKKSAFIVELVFRHLGKRLVSREDDHTIREAVDFSFQGLLSQLRKKKQFSSIESPNQSLGRKAKDQARFSVFEDSEVIKQLSKRDFFEAVEDHLARAKSFVLSEIRFLESSGEIPGGELEADELVDEVILEMWNNREKLSKGSDFLSTFYGRAIEVLHKEVKRLKKASNIESLEERVASAETDDRNEEEFWQPDDAPTLADTLALPRVSSTNLDRFRGMIQHKLASFDPKVRQAFNLVYQSGFSIPETASILKRQRRDVERDIEAAIKELKKQLSRS